MLAMRKCFVFPIRKFENVLHALAAAPFFLAHFAQGERIGKQARFEVHVLPDQDIVERRHIVILWKSSMF